MVSQPRGRGGSVSADVNAWTPALFDSNPGPCRSRGPESNAHRRSLEWWEVDGLECDTGCIMCDVLTYM